ncbi:MAG: ribosome recycling factor [Acidobacteria bacterium]|nr:ribosome recycling factor [Acidobacteriota bacterium]
MIKEITKEAKNRMEHAIEDFRRKLGTVRTGRASTTLLDNIHVDAYGTQMPINQLSTIHAPEAALITVQPFDPQLSGAIEKAIRSSDLGLNPANDGKLIRIPIPALTEERRRQLAKVIGEMSEEHKTAIRNIRRDANDKLKKALKEKTVSEDEEKDGLSEVQKLTDAYVTKVSELAKHKEDEIMKV